MEKRHLVMILAVVIISVLPLIIYSGLGEEEGYFGGADDSAGDAIAETGYEPWFEPIWEPPSGEIESLLFAVQAAIGALIIGYVFGYYRGRGASNKTFYGDMHMNVSVDYYAHTNGLRNTSPAFKMALALITMIISLASPTPLIPFTVAVLMTLIILLLADIPPAYYLKFAAVPAGFGLLTLILMALFFGVNPVWSLMGIKVYSDGLNTGLLVFSRIMGVSPASHSLPSQHPSMRSSRNLKD